jgi:hypothetical protein
VKVMRRMEVKFTAKSAKVKREGCEEGGARNGKPEVHAEARSTRSMPTVLRGKTVSLPDSRRSDFDGALGEAVNAHFEG